MRERRQARQHANRCNPQVNAHILVHMLNAVADVVGQDAGNRRVLVRAFVEEHRAAKQHNAVAGQDAGENAQSVRLNTEMLRSATSSRSLPYCQRPRRKSLSAGISSSATTHGFVGSILLRMSRKWRSTSSSDVALPSISARKTHAGTL